MSIVSTRQGSSHKGGIATKSDASSDTSEGKDYAPMRMRLMFSWKASDRARPLTDTWLSVPLNV